MKVYLAHALASVGEFKDSKRVAEEIRKLGFEVYVASENDSINDKTNEPSTSDIYNGDIKEIIDSDIFVAAINGGLQDGTISEIGFVSGWNEGALADRFKMTSRVKPIIAYTSNARLAHPQFHKGVPSASVNHLVLGMCEKWGEFVGGEAEMLAKLSELQSEGIVL